MDNKLDTIRHSVSHLMAAAVKQLFPGVKFAIGPTIDEGFYYDFDLPRNLTPEDLPKIEERMVELMRQNLPFEKYEVPFQKAMEMAREQPYKMELIQEIQNKNEPISFYKVDSFVDLCRGPHIANTKEINLKAFKLIKIAGAYWRGSEKNKMLQRIYGTAFFAENELKKFLKQKEEAEMRDHRKVGKEQELFMLDEEIGQGLILWLPKGAWLRRTIMDFAFNTYLEKGYLPVSTPHIASNRLWQHSGHTQFFKESMYGEFKVEEETYRLKPMNCPFHVAIYKNKIHSYKELPLRYTEMGTVYRYEKSGVLHGLNRVRGFTQDDAHIICTPEQLTTEVKNAFKLTLYILKSFGFKEFEVNLSVRDPLHKESFIGSDKDWEVAEKTLESVLKEVGYGNKYAKDVGGAIFYGPKIDLKVSDSLGRKWQLSTIQFDFNLPGRFNMKYTGADGKEHTPYMIHRALLGSLERFIGVLIEHFAGAFPIWLSPVQVQIIPVGSRHVKFSEKLGQQLSQESLRVNVDDVNETVGYKIRKAEKMRVPYMLVIGDKEMKAKSLAVRDRGKKVVRKVALKKFITEIKKKIEDKK